MTGGRALLLLGLLAVLPWSCSGCPVGSWTEPAASEPPPRKARDIDSRPADRGPEPEQAAGEEARAAPEPPRAVTLHVGLGDVVPVRFEDGREVTLVWGFDPSSGHIHLGVRPSQLRLDCLADGAPVGDGLRVDAPFGAALALPWDGTASELRCTFRATEPAEILAVFAPAVDDPDADAPRTRFPSDAVLDELASQLGRPFPAGFTRSRQSPWGIPRLPLLAKAAAACARLETPGRARGCGASLLAALYDALSRELVESQAMLRSLAVYLDDDALAQAVTLLGNGNTASLASMEPAPSAVCAARAIADRLYAAADASVADSLAARPGADPDATAAAAPSPSPTPAPAPVATPLPAPAPTEKLRPLARELRRSRAGRELLESITGRGRREELTAVALLVAQLESEIRSSSAQLADGGDAQLIAAARALDDVPRRAATPTAAVMVLLDEWTERATTPDPFDSVLERLRKRKLPRRDAIESWLAAVFPIQYPRAQRILGAVTPPPAAPNDGRRPG